MRKCDPRIEEIEMFQTEASVSFLSDETLSRRQIVICSEITKSTFESFKLAYDALIEDNNIDPIHIVLGSPGGDLSSTLGIMNLILLSETPVYTYLIGETCSGGALIYLCGHKRFAASTNLVSLMLHPIGWEKDGNHGEQEALVEYMNSIRTKFKLFIDRQTKIPNDLLDKLGEHKTKYFVGTDLFTFGIATDELTTSAFWIPKKTTKGTTKKTTKKTLTD